MTANFSTFFLFFTTIMPSSMSWNRRKQQTERFFTISWWVIQSNYLTKSTEFWIYMYLWVRWVMRKSIINVMFSGKLDCLNSRFICSFGKDQIKFQSKIFNFCCPPGHIKSSRIRFKAKWGKSQWDLNSLSKFKNLAWKSWKIKYL